MFGTRMTPTLDLRRGTKSGFALAELLVSMTIFSLVVGLCFYAASAGFRIFAHTTSRQSLQREARAIFAWLQRDMGLSNLVRCRTSQRSNDGHRRDGVAVVGLDSWQTPLSTDPLGLPAWDRVVIYVATRDSSGLLLRQLYAPNSALIPLTAGDVQSILNEGLAGTTPPSDQRRLSGSVRSFQVDLSEERNQAVFDLVLEDTTVDGGGGRARKEVLQIQTTVRPHNTWPRL